LWLTRDYGRASNFYLDQLLLNLMPMGVCTQTPDSLLTLNPDKKVRRPAVKRL